MASEKTCPCDALINTRDEVIEHREQLRLGDIAMAKINTTLENIEEKMENLEKTIDKKFEAITKDINELKMKPAKRWDNLTNVLITLIVGAIFGIVLSQLGL